MKNKKNRRQEQLESRKYKMRRRQNGATTQFNRVEEENKIPIQQRKTKIKSVYKGVNTEKI